MHMCTAIAAGGTNQRLNKCDATVLSRQKKGTFIRFFECTTMIAFRVPRNPSKTAPIPRNPHTF